MALKALPTSIKIASVTNTSLALRTLGNNFTAQLIPLGYLLDSFD
jgi:hypothetical protein